MSLTLDRQAFIDIIADGQGAIGGVMQPPPDGLWGMPPDTHAKLAGLRPRCRAEPRQGPQDHGEAGLRARTTGSRSRCRRATSPPYRDPAVILIDQLKEIYIDAELDPIDTTQWYPTLMRKDYKVGMNVTETAVDDPDVGILRELRLRRAAQLHRLLQSRGRQADRPAIGRDQSSRSARSWCGRSSAS